MRNKRWVLMNPKKRMFHLKLKSLFEEDNVALDTIFKFIWGLPLLGFLFVPRLFVYLIFIVIALNCVGLVIGKFISEKLFRIAFFGLVLYGFILLGMYGLLSLMSP